MKSQNHKSTKHGSEFVRATNLKTGEILYFKNGQTFAEFANCSHPLTYMALDGNISSARGWRLEWVDRDLPECEAIRIQVENERQAKEDEKEMEHQAKLAKAREETRIRKEAIRKKKEELNQQHKELILRLKAEQRRARMEDVVKKRQIKLKKRELKAQANKELWELHIVLQCDLDGNILREWRTARDAELETGIRGIGVAIRNGKPFRGYIWKYKVPREPRTYTND